MATKKQKATAATTPKRTRAKGPARARASAEVTEEPVASEPDPVAPFAPENATLGVLARMFTHHLEEQGKAPGTTRSYASELKLACSILGAETRLADLTPEMIRGFNEHERVVRTRDGVDKAQVGINKTRRVLRLALLWGTAAGYVDPALMAAVQD